MLQPSLNPYPTLGKAFSDGLDSIIAGLPAVPTVKDLVTEVVKYVTDTVVPFPQKIVPIPEACCGNGANTLEVSSICYSAINSYTNGPLGNYSLNQWRYMGIILGSVATIPFYSVNDRILDTENELIQSALPVSEQNPVLMSTMIGTTMHSYFLTQIGLGGGSAWNTYLSASLPSATINLPFWDIASMSGALIGAKSTVFGMVPSTINIVDVELFSCLTAALTIAAGQVIFQWTRKIKLPPTSMPMMPPIASSGKGGCGCSGGGGERTSSGSGGGPINLPTGCVGICAMEYTGNLGTCAEIALMLSWDPPASITFYAGCALIAFGGYRGCVRGCGGGGYGVY